MDRSGNDRISILFTESHKILSNSRDGYGMYEIHMNGGIKIIVYSNLYSNSNLQEIELERG